MKKVVITKDNYEEVLFNLLEDQYTKEQREDILNQIDADTFLSFEWKQWSKAQYSESLEFYKRDEAPFIESLVKSDDKKGFIISFYRPLAVAASLAFLITMSVLFLRRDNKHDFVDSKVQNSIDSPLTLKSQANPNIKESMALEGEEQSRKQRIESRLTQAERDIPYNQSGDLAEAKDTLLVKEIPVSTYHATIQDTVEFMIADAIKKYNVTKSRYKITITETSMEGREITQYKYNEKRYSMADVMVHKDGITLSKFLDNSNSKIVKTNNTMYIEYIAADNSILVLTLSN